MTSFGDVQYPQYPSLDAAVGYNYDDLSQSRGGNIYRHPVIHEDPYTSSGSSGYADSSPSGYGPQQHYPSHSGPSSTGYGGSVAHAPPQPQPTKPTIFGNLKKGSNSAMAALTLLSFLFFVNMLQNCLKDHMATMNPTVMVMTNPVVRNRYSKLTEMNSREQNNSPESTSVQEQSEHLNEATTASPPTLATIAATLSVVKHNKPTTESVQLQSTPSTIDQSNLSPYESPFNYSNRTVLPSTSNSYPDRYRPENYYNDRYHSPFYEDTPYWSHHRPHSQYGHSAPDFYWDRYESRHFPNHDSYDDTSYLRIY